jgi:hypothetical protein
VPAMPASSMITSVPGPTPRIHSGGESVPRAQISLASVSQGAPMASRSPVVATADGATPSTLPPQAVHARARAARAVVLPVPAGASASWTRAPLPAR